MTRTTIMWLAVALGLGALSYGVSRKLVAGASLPSRTPFTAVMVERDYRAGALTPNRTANYIYAVQQDGSWVRDSKRQVEPNGSWGDMKVVMDYSTGARTAIDPFTKSITTHRFSGQEVAKLSARPASSCGAEPGASHKGLLGYDAVLVKQSPPSHAPGEQLSVTEWLAPSLGCFPLEQIITFDNGRTSSRVERTALFVEPGEPSKSLFEIPGDYVERSPSQVLALSESLYPSEPTTPTGAERKLDQVYESRQVR